MKKHIKIPQNLWKLCLETRIFRNCWKSENRLTKCNFSNDANKPYWYLKKWILKTQQMTKAEHIYQLTLKPTCIAAKEQKERATIIPWKNVGVGMEGFQGGHEGYEENRRQSSAKLRRRPSGDWLQWDTFTHTIHTCIYTQLHMETNATTNVGCQFMGTTFFLDITRYCNFKHTRNTYTRVRYTNKSGCVGRVILTGTQPNLVQT